MLDAARGASAASITAVIPHYAYARSDKKDAPRISIGGRLVADLIATAGADRVVTMALHAPQVHGFFSVPVDHLSAIGDLAMHYRGRDLSNTVVVSPDLGNAKAATAFARLLDVPVAAGSKQRLADDRVVIDMIVGDVDGKDVIVLDDEIATGGSVVEPARGAALPARAHRLAGVHPRPVHRPGHRAALGPRRRHRGGHHQHRAAGRALRAAAPRGPLGRAGLRRGDQPHPPRRVGVEPVLRRPHPRLGRADPGLSQGLAPAGPALSPAQAGSGRGSGLGAQRPSVRA
nr:ribose-phosphate diphosphokinase [Angustibacter aerolatus]